MYIEIKARGTWLYPTERRQLEGLLQVGFREHGGRIRAIAVLVEESRGPGGVPEARCRIAVALAGGPVLVARAEDYHLKRAFRRALWRARLVTDRGRAPRHHHRREAPR
jgi:hypothetical protein